MDANVVVANQTLTAVRDALVGMVDWFDGPARVRLVSTTFNPADATTYPVTSTSFAAKDAGGLFEVQFDALSGKWFLVALDPDEGWDFTSTAAGDSIVGFIVAATADANEIGGNLFVNPIPVTAVGQHITLPWVTIDITQMVLQAITPYAMP